MTDRLNESREILFREARHFSAVWLRQYKPKEPLLQRAAEGLCRAAEDYAEASRAALEAK